MSGWSTLAGTSVLISAAIALLVVRRVADEAGRTVAALQRVERRFPRLDTSGLLDRAEHLAARRQPPTGPPGPPR